MDSCFLASLSSIIYFRIDQNDRAGKMLKSAVKPSTGNSSLSCLALTSSIGPSSTFTSAKWIPPSGS